MERHDGKFEACNPEKIVSQGDSEYRNMIHLLLFCLASSVPQTLFSNGIFGYIHHPDAL